MKKLQKALSVSLSLLIALLSPGLAATRAFAADEGKPLAHPPAIEIFKEIPRGLRAVSPNIFHPVDGRQPLKPAPAAPTAPGAAEGPSALNVGAAAPARIDLWGPENFQEARRISARPGTDAASAKSVWDAVWFGSRQRKIAPDVVIKDKAAAATKSDLKPSTPRSSDGGGLLGLAIVPAAAFSVPVVVPGWMHSLWTHYGAAFKLGGIAAAAVLASGAAESAAGAIARRLGGDVVAQAKWERRARYAVLAAAALAALRASGLAAAIVTPLLASVKSMVVSALPYIKGGAVLAVPYALDEIIKAPRDYDQEGNSSAPAPLTLSKRLARVGIWTLGAVASLEVSGLAAPLLKFLAPLRAAGSSALAASEPYLTLGAVSAAAYSISRLTDGLVKSLRLKSRTAAQLLRKSLRGFVWGFGLAFGLHASGLASPLIAWASANGKYFHAGGIALGVYAFNRAVRSVINKIGNRLDKETDWARRIAGAVIWIPGATAILRGLGFGASTIVGLYNGAGLATVALWTRGALDNHWEGIKFLLNRPFNIGDRIEIEGTTYVVKDLSLREITLIGEGLTKSPNSFTYTQLSGKIITVLNDYRVKSQLAAAHKAYPQVWPVSPAQLGRAAAAAALFAVLSLGAPALTAALPSALLAMALPYIKGGLVLYAVRTAEQFVSNKFLILAAKRSWGPGGALALRLGIQGAFYVLGGTLATNAASTLWGLLKEQVGFTLAASFTTAAVILPNFTGLTRILTGLLIYFQIPQKISLGDTIRIPGYIPVTGTVIGWNPQYLILSNAENSHILVPYPALDDRSFDRVDPADLPAAGSQPGARKP